MLTFITLIIVGFVAVLVGGEILVRGAVHLAKMLRVSALLISLTIVAIGTSAPEFAISLKSVREGMPNMAIGNIVGSNIFNTLFILGLCATIAPLKVRPRTLYFDVPMMVVASLMLFFFARSGNELTRAEGILMFGTVIVFLIGRVMLDRYLERRPVARMLASNKGIAGESVVVYEEGEAAVHDQFTLKRLAIDLVFFIGGLVLLVCGAQWLVSGAEGICKSFGVSELLIGLTVLAVGTSLPEIVISVLSTLKGEPDVAVGNIVGSNTMNTLCILAPVVILAGGIPVSLDALTYDIPIMLGIILVCVPVFASSLFISRPEGIFFLTAYAAYSVFLYFKTVESPLLTKVCWTLGIGLAVLLAVAMAAEQWVERRMKNEELGMRNEE